MARRGVCEDQDHLSSCSSCPSTAWLDKLAPQLVRPLLTYVDVGGNKGYHINQFLQRFHRGWTTTNPQWKRVWQHASGSPDDEKACGPCGECTTPAPIVAHAAPTRHSSARVIAVEAQNASAAALQSVFAALGVPGEVVHAAGGSQRSRRETLYEPSSTSHMSAAGMEGVVLRAYRHGQRLRVVTVDELLGTRGIDVVDMLTVDVDGMDREVLEGARRTLRARKVRILEFEFSHSWGRDPRWQLQAETNSLRRDGYACFWQSDQGLLAPVNLTACKLELPRRGGRIWRNVLCAHEAADVTALRTLTHWSGALPPCE